MLVAVAGMSHRSAPVEVRELRQPGVRIDRRRRTGPAGKPACSGAPELVPLEGKRVALVAERNTAVQMKFTDSQLILDAQSGDEAMASEALEASIDGEDITTGFNPQFLLDGLTAIPHPFVELAFTQASKPVVISGLDALDGEPAGEFRYLLMPRRLLS